MAIEEALDVRGIDGPTLGEELRRDDVLALAATGAEVLGAGGALAIELRARVAELPLRERRDRRAAADEAQVARVGQLAAPAIQQHLVVVLRDVPVQGHRGRGDDLAHR